MGKFRVGKSRESYAVDDVQVAAEREMSKLETRFTYVRELSTSSSESTTSASALDNYASCSGETPSTSLSDVTQRTAAATSSSTGKPKTRKRVTFAGESNSCRSDDEYSPSSSLTDVSDDGGKSPSLDDLLEDKMADMFTQEKTHRRVPKSWVLGGNAQRGSLPECSSVKTESIAD